MRRSTANAIHVSTLILLTLGLSALNFFASFITAFASFGLGICGGPGLPIWQILVFFVPVAAALSALTASVTFRPLWWFGAVVLNGPLIFLSAVILFDASAEANDRWRAIVIGGIMPLISLVVAYRVWKRRCQGVAPSHIRIGYDPVEPLSSDEWPESDA